MDLGRFSLSLSVQSLDTSLAFYTRLGFVAVGGDAAQGWLILQQGSTILGLFQGMFEGNLLTFNPGWGQDRAPLTNFEDVREIQAQLQAQGIEPVVAADPAGIGPAHIVIVDPDGNKLLIDQHVPRPG